MSEVQETAVAENVCSTVEDAGNLQIKIEAPDSSSNLTATKIETNDENKEQISNDEILHLDNMSTTELIELCRNSNSYINDLEAKIANQEAELISAKSHSEYPKIRDSSYREKILLRKLALKDQEIQDLITQLNEFKSAQIASIASLKSVMLDPAVNIIVQKLKSELSRTEASLEETQNELNAWKFTPDSNTGKRLMAKCRLLHQENEELGKMISSGRVAKLEGELAMQKNFSEEVKKSQFELDELLQDLDEDVEGMQGTIYYLQQELKKSKEKVSDLEIKNQQLQSLLDQNRKPSEKGTKIETLISNTNNADIKETQEVEYDSTCLILKINPEEEFPDEESTECANTSTNTKRPTDDGCEKSPKKKVKQS